MTSSELKQAHRNAKKAQIINGGDYVVYLSFYMKKENRVSGVQVEERIGQYGDVLRTVVVDMKEYVLEVTEDKEEDKEEFFFVHGTTDKTKKIYNILAA